MTDPTWPAPMVPGAVDPDAVWGKGNWMMCDPCPHVGQAALHHKNFHEPRQGEPPAETRCSVCGDLLGGESGVLFSQVDGLRSCRAKARGFHEPFGPAIDKRWRDLAAALPNHPAPEGVDEQYLGPTCPWCGMRTASERAWESMSDDFEFEQERLAPLTDQQRDRLCWGECGGVAMQRAQEAVRTAYVAGDWLDYGADDDDYLGVIRDLLVALHAAKGETLAPPHR